MSDTNETEKRGIELVWPLLLEWQRDNTGIINTNDAASSEIWQRTIGDFVLHHAKLGQFVGVEVKTEKQWTGNFYAETYSNAWPTKYERWGWLATLQADILVNVFLDRQIAAVMRLPRLREWCIDQDNARKYTLKPPHRSQRNLTLGHIIPFKDLVAPVGAEFYRCDDFGFWFPFVLEDIKENPWLLKTN